VNILVVEPLALSGHVKSNAYFLDVLSELGTVTFATQSSYHQHFDVERRIEIPERPSRAKSLIGIRVEQARALRHIRRSVDLASFDLTFFLCYEETVLPFFWPSDHRTYVFEHVNVDKVLRSRVKDFCFRRIGNNVTHLAYFKHTAEFITSAYGREAYKISRPFHRDYTPAPMEEVLAAQDQPKVIFAPSGGETDESVSGLVRLAEQGDKFRVVAKSRQDKTGPHHELRKYFDDYDAQMAGSDFVFFGGRYSYRGSGVVWEAFNFCKPAILLDCLLAREMKKLFPATINVVNDVSEIAALEIDYAGVYREHEAFLQAHSFESIKAELQDVFRRHSDGI
jgi:hypothetical protein